MALPDPDTSYKYGIELIRDGAGNAFILINEALVILDATAQIAVNDELTAPPASPTEGVSYLIVSTATGIWAGKEDQIALRKGGGWHYITPQEGQEIHINDTDVIALYTGSGWVQNGTVADLSQDYSAFTAGEQTTLNAIEDKINDILTAMRLVHIIDA